MRAKMWKYILKLQFLIIFFTKVTCQIRNNQNLIELTQQKPVISIENYVFWKNATVPFYINPDNFDHEQSLAILQALSLFAFKTCLKFAPVMAPPASNEHVLVFENSGGVRRCVFNTLGHSVFEPHRVVLGYDCMQSPQIDMVIMRALGLPFEHNRINRGVYIDVLEENIEQGSINLFTKETTQPIELRAIPYDINSVLHFGPRDFSKNGHRTILFKDPNTQQYRSGLTKMDLRKIEVVYGPHCRARDRQEKIELCQSYPGVARKKRDTRSEADMSSRRPEIYRKKRDADIVTKSLRVNPEITPPPNAIKDTLTELGIDDAVQNVVEQVYKVSALALKNARQKYCNNTKPNLRSVDVNDRDNTDILGIIEVIAHYAQGMVNNAVANLTKFCGESESIEVYQRARCSWNDGSDRCRQTYRSTKSGAVKYSTQHRPVYIQSTNHRQIGHGKKIYDPMFRSSNNSDEATTETVNSRRKRETDGDKDAEDKEGDKQTSLGNQEDNKGDLQVKNEREQSNRDNEQGNDKADHRENVEKEDKAESKREEKVENLDKKDEALRAGTTVPPIRVNRYEPERRRARRSRVRYSKNDEEMDLSSLSIESRPRKHHRQSPNVDSLSIETKLKKNHRQSPNVDSLSIETRPKKNHRQSPNVDSLSIELTPKKSHRQSLDVDRQKKHRETTQAEERWRTKRMKRKDRKERERENESKEMDVTTERYKRPRKEKTSELIPQIVKLSKANEEFYNDRKWPGGVVRYLIEEDTTYNTDDLRNRLEMVNNILKRKTCVRLKEITADQAQNYEDYIVINNSQDYVTGRVGGRQTFGSIELFRGDQHRQHTAMMVMAMLGFYFEVSRHDRDKYVRIHMRHVRPDKLHHFEKIRDDATLPLPYDYKSATHPAWQYWRQIGKTGISTVATYKQQDPEGSVMKSLGQNSKLLSDIDIVKINSVYGIKCHRSERSKTKENEAEPSPKLSRGQNVVVTVA